MNTERGRDKELPSKESRKEETICKEPKRVPLKRQ